MLLRLLRLLKPRPASNPYAQPYIPRAPVLAGKPQSDAASDHYPPLTRKLSPADIEAAAFAGESMPGDEIWAFSSPAEDWQARGGRAGAALVRNGVVIRSVVTRFN